MPPVNLIKGDITKIKVDAIVNAANTTLMGFGGVDGAIHRAAGPAFYGACENFHGCPTGDALITCGFTLTAQFLLHPLSTLWLVSNIVDDHLL
ncbi:macro domain-containing protein, partial [Limosilactobacillus reuteri]|uniref:macro domain-containing protein n=1 Tax=Limosilactobacillus reuteri TaxID=1598 RepID=UPI000BD8D895